MAEKGGSFVAGFILGGIAGGIAALLLSPKTGKEIREELSEDAEKILARAKEELEHAKKIAMDKFEEEMSKIRNDDEPEAEEIDAEVTAEDAEGKEENKKRSRGSRRGRPRKNEDAVTE